MEDLLEKLGETNAALDAVAQDTSNVTKTSTNTIGWNSGGQRQTYRQLLWYQANLLNGVRNDVVAYKSSAAEALLAERGPIDNSHEMIDATLEQPTRRVPRFARQRSSLGSIQTRMVGVLSTVPGINNILCMIHKRPRRDT
ncbi:hypothetical protein BGW80DRAFT_57032 [Lactifluus volemus]|nr:hypothetical protein BGW80DRAFT_57032 [Lactifluus volemus]